jgi:hypothetical protein
LHVHAASSAASCNETLLSGHSRHDSSATALYVPNRHAAQVAPSDKYPALQRHALAPVASVLFEFGGMLEQIEVEVPEKVPGGQSTQAREADARIYVTAAPFVSVLVLLY